MSKQKDANHETIENKRHKKNKQTMRGHRSQTVQRLKHYHPVPLSFFISSNCYQDIN